MKRILRFISLLVLAIIVLLLLYERKPIMVGVWTKQTIYLSLLNCLHSPESNDKCRIMLIDDDCGEGVFKIRTICNELGVKSAFAVIPQRLSPEIADSLVAWQRQGFGIVLHGYDHNEWNEWGKEEISEDINKSLDVLSRMGFDIKQIKCVAPPHACNTMAIRSVISDYEFKMITGASLVNPDTTVFQMGRILLTKKTDMTLIKEVLIKAKKRKMFLLLGTHSSEPSEFSEAKTKEVLSVAKEMGFEFITNI